MPSTYPLLINNRPPQASLLAIVKDAAARLPDAVGTRSDVGLLLMDSKYIAPQVTQQLAISAISGSLDRLSAERDPCVRYDCHYKLWVYLHAKRNLNSPQW